MKGILVFLLTVIALKSSAQRRSFKIGDTAFCGIVFYIDSNSQRGLVCALEDQHAGIRWHNGAYVTTLTINDHLFAKGSTDTIIRIQKPGIYAATACLNVINRACNNNDSTAWYLPSRSELLLIYKNLAVTKKRKFAKEGYWTSTEAKQALPRDKRNQRNAYRVTFLNGSYKAVDKVNKYHVVAVRAFTFD
jgi:hypothetical protein